MSRGKREILEDVVLAAKQCGLDVHAFALVVGRYLSSQQLSELLDDLHLLGEVRLPGKPRVGAKQ